MRILIGTLYSGENEFPECVAAIERQSHSDWEHFVIRDMPNKEAHVALYETFMSRASEFDLFAKIDADMVLIDDDFLANVAEKFRTSEWLEFLCVTVHDFFTDTPVFGLHVYRNTTTWEETDEKVFVDIYPRDPESTVMDDSELAPAAMHCGNPSPFQAFHFGMHKGVKFLEGLRLDSDFAILVHSGNIEQTWQHFLRSGDKRLGLASLGAELALRGDLQAEHLDYGDSYSRSVWEQHDNLDEKELRTLVRRLRRRNWGWVPRVPRRDIFRYGLVSASARQCMRDLGLVFVANSVRRFGRSVLPWSVRQRIRGLLGLATYESK